MFRRKHLSAGRQRSDNVRRFWRVAIVLFLSAMPPTALSEPRSDNDASTVVAQWLRLDSAPLNAHIGSRIGKVVPLKDSAGSVFAYAVHLKPAGFVIVPAEDEVEPVIAFSPGTDFKLSEDNPLGTMVLRDAAGRVRMARQDQETVAPGKARIRPTHAAAAKSKWDLLRERVPLLSTPAARDEAILFKGLDSISDMRVAPFVLSKWDQLQEGGQNCYNYYTPYNWYCGCVATVMAQWMRYFQRPTSGVGTGSFSITINGTPTTRNLRGGDGNGGPYSWADMPLDPDGSSSDKQRRAIGALCHDAGVAAHMQYSAGGAGAFSTDALIALTSTFGFSSGVYGHDGNRDLSGANLDKMINPNLHAKMPVMLAILRTGSSGQVIGHAVLADGYGYQTGTIYHHLNMGWGGNGDAWYNLPTIDPGNVYTSVFECVYNVYTSGVGEIVSGRITDSGGNAITGVVITAVNEPGAVFTAVSDVRGIYAVVNLPPSERYWLSPSRTGYAFTNLPADVGKSWSGTPLCGNIPGKDFIGTAATGPANPRSFAAWAKSASQVDLQWTKNTSNDNVLVAWGTTGAFGAPSGTYLPGTPIVGGGTVLYVGSGTTQSHAGLTSGTAFHYRAWSVDANTNYSAGSQLAVTTHAIYYVNDASTDGDVWCSTAGNDANSGAASNAPKATIQAVLDTYDLEPGDSVCVDTGSYVLFSNIVVGAGDQGSPQHHVTIQGSLNGTVIDRNCGANGAYGLYLNQADYMNLFDLSITGGYHSVFMYDADVCIVSNLTVRGATNCGVYMAYSWYSLFENLRVSGCKSDGIFTWYSARNKFSHGVVCNNNYNGLELRYSASNLVENCTIAFNTCDQIYLTGAETALFLTNSIVVASGSGKYCINWDGGAYVGDYNDLYTNNNACVGYCGGPRTAMSDWRTATSRDTNSISADPAFVDTANGDLHLKSTAGSWHGGAWTADTANSPGIDTGLPTSNCALEPAPNGGFVNLGAYGNTPQASKSADADSDGLSDTLETFRVGSNPFVADSDGDGVNDGDEWAAGTSPTNTASVFAIEQVAQPEPARAEVRWYSVTNRTYAIDRATNLMNGGFTALTNNIPATPPVNVYTDVVDGLGHTLFYRVKTQP
jgi:parallel beta-helix repeat protein